MISQLINVDGVHEIGFTRKGGSKFQFGINLLLEDIANTTAT
jgi:hypothetical protein